LPGTYEPENSGTWIILARSRLAQRRAEKPATKAGQIRALWPEIDAALAGGQSMKSIRKWLEEDAGINVGITRLTSYISRRERSNRRIDAPPLQSVREQTAVESAQVPLSIRPPLSTPRQTSRASRLHEDPLAQAMQALSKRPVDIREIHNDGDPNGQAAHLTKGKKLWHQKVVQTTTKRGRPPVPPFI
jgi:hypothetical protein